MDKPRRKQYLKAMGIDVWQPRAAKAQWAAGPSPALAPEPPATTARPEPVASSPMSSATPGPSRRRPSVPPVAPASSPVAAVVPPPVMREVPADWAGLRAMVKDCPACKLCETRTNTVFGVGEQNAPLMIVGEGPGADEDARGEPFVGRAGKLLDEMLKAIGRNRGNTEDTASVFIANVVKCRPPGNRDPQPDEVQACRPYLDRQIELLRPKLIVALGRVAAQRLLETDEPLSRLRGPLYHYGADKTPVMVTYHPAYLLRSPREKAKSWEDLKRIHRFLQSPA